MNSADPTQRANRSLWILTAIAVWLVGGLSRELTSPSSHLLGISVAVTGTVLALVLTQLGRLMLALERRTPAKRQVVAD
ncbi:MAG TPA: hypothetical protein VMV52_10650 [Candidatus Nanopelagicaceae bacterium]|nr:hypothetical protein [Candidatus Nanopelagicaceae bacterium]